MRRTKLLLNIVGYSSSFGLGWGAALGILYYLIIFQFSISIFILYFGVLGAILGVLFGGFNGIVLSLMTYKYHHKVAFLLVSIITTFISSLLVFYLIFSLYAVSQQPGQNIFWILLASTLATVAAGYMSQSIANLYQRNIEIT